MSVAEHILSRQTSSDVGHRRSRWLRNSLLHSLPPSWIEKEYGCKTLDKAFACAWEDERHILVGTKCNKLLRLDTASGAATALPLPPAPPRRREAYDHEWGHCGIHSIVFSPSRGLVATGGENPADAVVLDTATWRPVATLAGHLDWVFGLAWLSDLHLVTASRDQSVALWHLPDKEAADDEGCEEGDPRVQGGSGGLVPGPAPGPSGTVLHKDWGTRGAFRKSFGGKVRGVEYDAPSRTLATLSLEGAVRLHDPCEGLRLIRKIDLTPESHRDELVCLALTPAFAVVGRQADVVLVDVRSRKAPLVSLASPDANVGVRSVSVQGSLVSFGTGGGKVCMYDVRAGRLLPGPCGEAPFALETGVGWLDQNEMYWEHFAHRGVQHACYAHAWAPGAERLFACGGPLAFGMRGCYMGLWR